MKLIFPLVTLAGSLALFMTTFSTAAINYL
jgi:hypothetical protein